MSGTKTNPPSVDAHPNSATGLHDGESFLQRLREEAVYLVVTGGSARIGERFELWNGIVVGRGEDADIVLDAQGVSRKHARFNFRTDGTIFVEDLGSSNGTMVGERRVSRSPVEDGMRIQIGSVTLTVLHMANGGGDDSGAGGVQP